MSGTAELVQQVFAPLAGVNGTERMESYVAVPDRADPRWLLPAKGAGTSRVLANWSPFRLRSRLAWSGICTASRMGCLTDVPGLQPFDVEYAHDADWRALGWQWRDNPVVAVYVGTPGPRRKAALHLVERASGKCRLVVKVPLTAGAKVSLLHEAEVLQQNERRGYTRSPRMVQVQEEAGITAQTFVEGPPGSRRLTGNVWGLLNSLALPGEATTLREHAERWMRKIASGDANPTMQSAVDELLDDEPLPAYWVHGDFAPWNIRRMANGDCALIDWEDARPNGLPLLDAFHFLHMQDFLFGRRPTVHAVKLDETARAMGLSARLVCKLERAYLVEAHVKCMEQGRKERAEFVTRALDLSRRCVA